ncbi:MAG: M48 family metalloprotease [Desulfobacterales bacterium]|nr:M48 family metalloprotease [Desulfobacterales bacterium]
MARRSLRKIVILALTTFLVLGFKAGIPPAYPLSVEDERIAGEKFVENIRRYFEILDDDFSNEYINDLGHYLTKSLETRHFTYRFYIIKDNALNAFAGPGGHIFVYSGLVEVMEDLGELVGVICHEIGHVSARHLANRIEQNKKIALATMAGMLAGVLVGGKAGGTIMSGSMAAGIQTQLGYSREDERQADQLGFNYVAESDFDPSGMITTLKKLEKGQWLGTDRVPSYLQTHPGGSERISHIEIMLGSYTPKIQSGETSPFRRLFPLFKTVLRAKCMDPYDAERLFKMDLEKNPVLAHFGLGIVLKDRSEYAEAIEHFEKALERDPNSPPILRHLAETYQLRGKDKEAIGVLEKALKINDQDKATLFLLALSYQNLEEYSKAIPMYERLALMEPVKDEVFYNLGISYGRQERLALAHYHFGLYFKRTRELAKARFHFQKSESLAGNDEALKRRIYEAMKEVR